MGSLRGKHDEEARLHALRQLDLLDTAPNECFDRITRMASRLFDVPISAISLTDRDRQWFKSRVGVEHCEIPREKAPCAEVAESDAVLVVPDLATCQFYKDSLLAQSGVRFYAGAPLITRGGFNLGAMCVLDHRPRTVSSDQIAALQDLAAMVMAEIELKHAFGRIDPVSGLPNRNQFIEDLEDLARDRPGERRMAVLIDLADPNQVNETLRVLGPSYIDDLVTSATQAIQDVIGFSRSLYALDATHTVFLLDGDAVPGRITEALHSRLRQAISCRGIPIPINPTIGMSPFTLGESTPADVLRTAMSAAQDAREAESASGIYCQSRDETHRRSFTLLADLREALLVQDQLHLAFQPRIDLRSGACVGAEALLRWTHPRLGAVSPGEFIPLVEQTALVRPVTDWVIDTSLAQCAAWQADGLDLRPSINVSAANLEEEDFGKRLMRALRGYGIEPTAIEIEVTEGSLIRNGRRVVEQLEELKATGITIAIDDFGTGYSSLSYLRKLPASVLRIDQSFMRSLTSEARDRTLVRSMIGMAHDLGYRVVAEGVETPEVCDFLAECGCDEAQGYLISRPVSPEKLRAWLLERAAPAHSNAA